MVMSVRNGWTKRASLLGASSLACGLSLVMAGVAHAGTLPGGGTVAAGSASIVSNGHTTTITQSSQNAVINWTSFSVGQGNTVQFVDPNASSATLNRVTGGATSLIAGQILANGSVYLVNPNGISITGSGTVQTGGAFVASTLAIADADFMAGRLNFVGNGASQAVSNAGRITAGQGAYIALLGGAVANSGTITVPYGQLGLGSGEAIALDVNGGHFMQVAVPTRLVTGSTALVSNTGALSAGGGLVQLQAAVVKDAVRNVINMSGSINADSATGDGGTIWLIGGADTAAMAGTVNVSGSLSARATGASGHGGFIETSGAHVNLTGSDVNTLAAHGAAGTWLIDPTDFTVAASGGDETGAALTTALTQGNVTIQSSAGKHGGTLGNININDMVSWSANTLTLDAYGNIDVNAVMNATGSAAFVGITGDTGGKGVSTGGALNFGLSAKGFTGTLNLVGSTSFTLNGVPYTIITSLGAAGSTTGTDLQGINGNLSGNYVLGSNIDASATASWNGGAGFTSLGTDGKGNVLNGGNGFTGAFNGLGHTISNLAINSGANYVGLFGYVGVITSILTNIGLVGGNLTGGNYAGGLVGYSTDNITNVYTTDSVTGTNNYVGGLIGYNYQGTISNAYATGNILGMGYSIGGLVGSNNGGAISNAYATGGVSGIGNYVGGLLGYNYQGTITNAYATGIVTGNGEVGGLVGQNYGSISNVYANGNVAGTSNNVGGLVGENDATITNAYATGSVTGTGNYAAGGLVGWNNGGTISNAYATGSVKGTGNFIRSIGGLVGSNGGTISNAYATGNVSSGGYNSGGLAGDNYGNYGTIINSYATGSVSGTSNIGGLVGQTYSSISSVYATGNVIGTSNNVGGLVGENHATITNAYATGNATGTGNYAVGGLVGWNNSGTISNAFATGSVKGAGNFIRSIGGLVGSNGGTINNAYAAGNINSGGYNAGGLAGDNYGNYGTIINSYATGSVSGTSNVGGLVGTNGGTITNTHAAGGVSGTGTNVGGLVGWNNNTISTSTWDSYSTGQANGVGYGTSAGVSAVTSDPTQSGAANYAFKASGYSFSDPGDWVFINGVRPMGVWEEAMIVNGVAIITNAHQLQLINASSATLSGSYMMTSNIDLSATGAITACAGKCTASAYAGMWSNAGFISLGTDGQGNILNGGTGFSGNFNGAGYTISNLTIHQANGNYAALFGYIDYGIITNVGLIGASVTGSGNYVGALVGLNASSTISNVYTTGSVTGTNYVGGLVGANVGTLTNAYSTGSVTGYVGVGGLVGANVGAIKNAYAIVGVTGITYVGGLVGWNGGHGTVNYAYATGNVTGTYDISGLVGWNSGLIDDAYTTGSVSGNGNYNNIGGLVGYNIGRIRNAYASGKVTGTGANVGGLVGQNSGAISTSYWDSYATGQANGVGSGTSTGVSAVTSDPTQSGAGNYAFNAGAYQFSDPKIWVFKKGKRPTLKGLGGQ